MLRSRAYVFDSCTSLSQFSDEASDIYPKRLSRGAYLIFNPEGYKMDRTYIANFVRDHRNRHGIKQEELALKKPVSPECIDGFFLLNHFKWARNIQAIFTWVSISPVTRGGNRAAGNCIGKWRDDQYNQLLYRYYLANKWQQYHLFYYWPQTKISFHCQ